MNDYLVPSGGLTPDQAKDIVQGRVPIPDIYLHGTPIRISLELARNNYLREVENRYLRFIKWVVAGAAVVTIAGLGYLGYASDRLGKEVKQMNVALKQGVDEFSASVYSLQEIVKNYKDSSITRLGEVSKNLEMIRYQISEELKKMNEELKNARNDLRDTRADLLMNAGDDLRDIREDLESVMEPNSIK